MAGEASRANGAKGGRPSTGQKSTAEYQARHKAKMSLQEACQDIENDMLQILERIAQDEKSPANARISAILAVFDRGRGKAVQPVDGHMNGTVLVVAGVPEPDEPPTIEHQVEPSTSDNNMVASTDEGFVIPEQPVPPEPKPQVPPSCTAFEEAMLSQNLGSAEPKPDKPKQKTFDWSRD